MEDFVIITLSIGGYLGEFEVINLGSEVRRREGRGRIGGVAMRIVVSKE